MTIAAKAERLPPLLKYPGGKEKELKFIIPNLPVNAENYFEPFVGGGAVFFSLDANNYFINDKSSELMRLYNMIRTQNTEFFYDIEQLDYNWKLISDIVYKHKQEIGDIYGSYKSCITNKRELHDKVAEFILHNADEFNGLLSVSFNVEIQNFVNELIKSFNNKMLRMAEIEKENGPLSQEDFLHNTVCAFKSAFYMHFRFLYNNASSLNLSEPFSTAIYFYIREFCYSSMFRYNANGEFNVPYGGISYNRKTLSKKIEQFKDKAVISHLQKTHLSCLDFESFLERYTPQKNDFMFLDPPYDSEFSTYAKNSFDCSDQARLANYLKKKCDCMFMLVIKKSELILRLYEDGELDKSGRRIKIESFDKNYFVSFQNRNNKKAEHLIITNYE